VLPLPTADFTFWVLLSTCYCLHLLTAVTITTWKNRFGVFYRSADFLFYRFSPVPPGTYLFLHFTWAAPAHRYYYLHLGFLCTTGFTCVLFLTVWGATDLHRRPPAVPACDSLDLFLPFSSGTPTEGTTYLFLHSFRVVVVLFTPDLRTISSPLPFRFSNNLVTVSGLQFSVLYLDFLPQDFLLPFPLSPPVHFASHRSHLLSASFSSDTFPLFCLQQTLIGFPTVTFLSTILVTVVYTYSTLFPVSVEYLHYSHLGYCTSVRR